MFEKISQKKREEIMELQRKSKIINERIRELNKNDIQLKK